MQHIDVCRFTSVEILIDTEGWKKIFLQQLNILISGMENRNDVTIVLSKKH